MRFDLNRMLFQLVIMRPHQDNDDELVCRLTLTCSRLSIDIPKTVCVPLGTSRSKISPTDVGRIFRSLFCWRFLRNDVPWPMLNAHFWNLFYWMLHYQQTGLFCLCYCVMLLHFHFAIWFSCYVVFMLFLIAHFGSAHTTCSGFSVRFRHFMNVYTYQLI